MLASPEAQVDPARCPLCGRPNGCRLAAAGFTAAAPARADELPQEPCWCFSMRFPAALLARVPEHARNRACICRACLEEALAAEARAGGS